jgi:hypothetical protein
MNKTSPLHDAKVDAPEIDDVQVGTHHAELKSGAAIASSLVAELLNDFDTDCNSLAPTKLRQKYSAEANAHMNMLARRKLGFTAVPEFLKFRSFLKIVGRIPAPGYTLDRLNSADPEYAPGKVRWASKKEQAVNKQNVILLTGTNGVVRPLTEWAEVLKIPATTLKSRRAKGWTDAEVLYYGKKSTITYAKAPTKYHAASVFPWPKSPAPPEGWEARYQRRCERRYEGNVESRARFLVRVLTAHRQDLLDELERTTCPGDEPDAALVTRYNTCTAALIAARAALGL